MPRTCPVCGCAVKIPRGIKDQAGSKDWLPSPPLLPLKLCRIFSVKPPPSDGLSSKTIPSPSWPPPACSTVEIAESIDDQASVDTIRQVLGIESCGLLSPSAAARMRGSIQKPCLLGTDPQRMSSHKDFPRHSKTKRELGQKSCGAGAREAVQNGFSPPPACDESSKTVPLRKRHRRMSFHKDFPQRQ